MELCVICRERETGKRPGRRVNGRWCARSDGCGMRVFIGIFTTCDRKGRADGLLSSVNYRRTARRSAACLLSWLDPCTSPERDACRTRMCTARRAGSCGRSMSSETPLPKPTVRTQKRAPCCVLPTTLDKAKFHHASWFGAGFEMEFGLYLGSARYPKTASRIRRRIFRRRKSARKIRLSESYIHRISLLPRVGLCHFAINMNKDA